MKKLALFLVLPVAVLIASFFVIQRAGEARSSFAAVPVSPGTVVREAVAIGRIETEVEVPVTSPNPGVLTRCFVQLGQKVAFNEPLVEVRPILTDAQRLAAERALLAAREGADTVIEYSRGQNLMGLGMLVLQGGQIMERMRRSAEMSRADAEAELELLLEGSVDVEGKVIDYLVRAPIAGHVIDLPTREGQPIVPASSYGPGTVLMTLGDLDRLVFRGTVDEIDVGRLQEGLTASVTIGALPSAVLAGTLSEISLKAQRMDNATVFAVEIALSPPPDLVLRSGYSAVARVEIARASDVLTLPERVVEFRADGAFVLVDDPGKGQVERRIEVGLSDGLTVEVVSGLQQGARVLERVY